MNGTTMRVKWIDAAKGIAIIMVVVVHLAQALALKGALSQVCSFGAMGVQLFFLMSAYCCCMTWKPERFNKGYWWHKYKRLAPWYVAGIAIYAAYWWMTGDSEKLVAYTVGNILANVAFVNDFIPSAQNSIVPGGWSISCIALFVFAFPILVGRFIPRPPCLALCSVGVLGVLVSVLGYRYWGWSRIYAYCNPLNQLIVFALGVVLWECRTMLKLRKNAILTGGGGNYRLCSGGCRSPFHERIRDLLPPDPCFDFVLFRGVIARTRGTIHSELACLARPSLLRDFHPSLRRDMDTV